MKQTKILCLLCVLLLPFSASAADNDDFISMIMDKTAIQDLLTRYLQALDTHDPDMYASVFTQDAVFDNAGDIKNGRAEIRGIITGLQASQASSQAAGQPATQVYHVILNSAINITGENTAEHHSYWQTLRKDENNAITIFAMGNYDDKLVKENGQWLINNRVITVFNMAQ